MSAPTIRPLDIGEYSLTITDNNNCTADTTIILTEPDPLMATAISGDPSCSGNYDGYIHIATVGGTEPYRYFMLDLELESTIVDSLYQGDYYIEVQDSNYCEYSFGPVTLVDVDRDCLNIPAPFSPNGDGYNDDWFLENIHLYPKSIVQIYNRWGQLLYEESGPSGFWDGNYNGKPVPTGVYIYLIILGTDEENRNGTVTIIR